MTRSSSGTPIIWSENGQILPEKWAEKFCLAAFLRVSLASHGWVVVTFRQNSSTFFLLKQIKSMIYIQLRLLILATYRLSRKGSSQINQSHATTKKVCWKLSSTASWCCLKARFIPEAGTWFVWRVDWKSSTHLFCPFVGPSVRLSVHPSVRPSVGNHLNSKSG